MAYDSDEDDVVFSDNVVDEPIEAPPADLVEDVDVEEEKVEEVEEEKVVEKKEDQVVVQKTSKVEVGDIKIPEKNGQFPAHDWIVTDVKEKDEIVEEKLANGSVRRVRKTKRKIQYKRDTGEVSYQSWCTIS